MESCVHFIHLQLRICIYYFSLYIIIILCNYYWITRITRITRITNTCFQCQFRWNSKKKQILFQPPRLRWEVVAGSESPPHPHPHMPSSLSFNTAPAIPIPNTTQQYDKQPSGGAVLPMGRRFFLLAGVVAGESWGVLDGVSSRLLLLTVRASGTVATRVSRAACSSSRSWSPAITLRTKFTWGAGVNNIEYWLWVERFNWSLISFHFISHRAWDTWSLNVVNIRKAINCTFKHVMLHYQLILQYTGMTTIILAGLDIAHCVNMLVCLHRNECPRLARCGVPVLSSASLWQLLHTHTHRAHNTIFVNKSQAKGPNRRHIMAHSREHNRVVCELLTTSRFEKITSQKMCQTRPTWRYIATPNKTGH